MALRVRETHGALPDEEVHAMFVPVEERWDSHDHLEDEDAERPPVNGKVVTVSNKHLRGKVLGSSAERVGELALLDELSQAEISHEEVS